MKSTCFPALLVAALAAMLTATNGFAAPDLKITEIYPGIAASGASDITEDWFELTNFGDMPWVFATDGSLYYEDESADPLAADLMTLPGATEIGAGQSIVYVNGGTEGLDGFLAAFPTVDPAIVGYFDGSGLGGGGDTVVVFTGDSNFPDDGISNEVLIASAGYPDQDAAVESGEAIDGASWDALNRKWSVEGVLGAFSSSTTSNIGTPEMPIEVALIGSPGTAVPEPASILLAAAAMLGLAATRVGK